MKPELDRTNKRLDQVNIQLDAIREKNLVAKGDIIQKDVNTGPIIYISKAFGISIEDASKYIILTIVSVFDPLAIMLILAANFLIKRKSDEKLRTQVNSHKLPSDKTVIPIEDLLQDVEPSNQSKQVSPDPKILVADEEKIEDLSEHVDLSIEPAVDVVPKSSYSESPKSEFIHESLPVVLKKQGVVL